MWYVHLFFQYHEPEIYISDINFIFLLERKNEIYISDINFIFSLGNIMSLIYILVS